MQPDGLNGNMKEKQNGILFHINSSGRYGDSLATEINDKDGYWNTPELECAMVLDDFTDVNGSEIRKSRPELHSDFFEKDTDLYTDKNVMECELPELMVCYKESGAYHVVKDICVDEGIRSEEKILIDNCKDNHEALTDSLPINGDKCGDVVKGSLETEFLMQDILRSSSGKDCGLYATDECDAQEKLDIALLTQDTHKDISSSSLPNNDKGYLGEKDDGAEPLIQEGLELKYENEVKVDIDMLIPDGHKDDHSDLSERDTDTESLLLDGLQSLSGKDCEHATDEFGTKQAAHIDLLVAEGIQENSDDSDDKTFPDHGPASNSDQGSVDDCGPEDLVETVEDSAGATDKLLYDASGEESDSNSMFSVKVFHSQTSLKSLLNSSEFGVDDDDAEQQPGQIPVAELSKTPAVVSETEEVSSSGQASNLLFNSEVESGNITFNFDADKSAAISEDEISKTDHDLPIEDGNLNNFTKASQGQQGAGESSFSVAGPISGLITYSGPDHEDGTSDTASLARLVQSGDGESSFSVGGPVSGRIIYSGPIPFSGSISLRSESSTTSTRSFAFPVLQNEWNSSPVRMAKADGRRFRKHGGWRQGLLCCRF